MAPPNKTQLAQAKRLQQKLLDRYERLLDSDVLSATDAANLQRLLENGGWILDEAQVPSSLKDKLKAAGVSLGEPTADDTFVEA